MSLVVNNNMMAANTARNLNAHYGRLATSTQRLSSGLRVNSAADDAAGLAIRELQRADIAALHQGARNANDAISMIQVADGSLGIIDEKLIRMKELAEQAATGTYDSTQRLMIESEYQAMASEITRIANATDFNGTKLLDGTLAGDHDGSGLISEGKMKIHFGTGNDSAEDYYYVEIGECTSEAFGLGNNSTWQDVQRRANVAFKESMYKSIKEANLDQTDKAKLLAQVDAIAKQVDEAISSAIEPIKAFELWSASDGIVDDPDIDNYDPTQDVGFLKDGKVWNSNSDLMDRFLAAAQDTSGATATIYAQYLANKGLAADPEALKADTQAWADADAALRASLEFTDNEIYIQFLEDQGLADSPAALKLLGTGAGSDWETAENDFRASLTFSDDEIYAKYLADKTLPANPEAFKAMGTGAGSDWEKAENDFRAALTFSDDEVYASYLNLHGFAADPKDLEANYSDKWEDARDALVLAGTADPTPQEIYNQYLADEGAELSATDLRAAGTGAGSDFDNALKALQKDAEVTDQQIYDQHLTTNGAKLSATDLKAAGTGAGSEFDDTLKVLQKDAEVADQQIYDQYIANNNAAMGTVKGTPGWSTAEDNLQANATVTDEEVYEHYLEMNKATLKNAQEDTAGWQAALDAAEKAAVDNGEDGVAGRFEALDKFWDSLRTTEKQKLQYAWGQAAIYNLANADPDKEPINYGLGALIGDFAELAGIDDPDVAKIANDIFEKALDDMYAKVGHMDFAGHTIETQEDAQHALDAINEAIVSKDKIRAHLGAAQNRLENTVSNLNIQAENLQAAESRISDVDVATEMTQFVRNQILTQSAVAMLSQANSLPQMAMQLIGG